MYLSYHHVIDSHQFIEQEIVEVRVLQDLV